MLTELFDYDLPNALIARHPTPARDGARMLTVGRDGLGHGWIRHWPELVDRRALVVLNQTRVLRARLRGRREPSQGQVELFLLRPEDRTSVSREVQYWSAFGRASSPLRSGTLIRVGDLEATVRERREGGELLLELRGAPDVDDAIERNGEVPIPPYLKRPVCDSDRERYQTVFAKQTGSVAAPTAGLHLTSAMLDRLVERGVQIARITLHVGAGTFKPVQAHDLDDHVMHKETFEVSHAVVEAIRRVRRARGPVIAVGTTVVRALESAADPEEAGQVRAVTGETSLMIRPGNPLRVVDGLLTNFHQPRSTLLALVSAFVGRARILRAYKEAIAREYRFLSYGDAMWIPERLPELEEP